jgi:phospholipase C
MDTSMFFINKKHIWLLIFLILAVVIAIIIFKHPINNPTHKSNNLTGIQKIKHVVIIMQENRSFDSYFGTYPGADGIPMKGGAPNVCVSNPQNGKCVEPYHDTNDVNVGGPHGQTDVIADIDGGKMDGFIAQAEKIKATSCNNDAECIQQNPVSDVMGYHNSSEIPNYWTYAKNFVLQDKMFESTDSWSLPEHLFLVSGWSAKCSQTGNPMSCVNEIENPDSPPDSDVQPNPSPNYAWTDLTYLLYKNNISWSYYILAGTEPDCEDDSEVTCVQHQLNAKTPGIWNPLLWFTTVKQDNQLSNIKSLDIFFSDARNGTLPAVSWITPSGDVSEHPPSKISSGQAYVTGIINAIMRSPDWNSTAIFLSWDDSGGFYDHVVPPSIDQNGYGLRVPGLVISPYAKEGYVDHQILSHDAYIKFIEDDFLGGQRIDPENDGRPDPRPNVRENIPQLGNLINDFDFNQSPRKPILLNPYPQAESSSVY